MPWWLALVIGVLVAAAVGALTHLLVMKPLRKASSLSRIAATLGVLLVLQGVVVLVFGSEVIVVDSNLPTTRIEFITGVGVTADRLILIGVAVVLSIVLWWVYKYTKFGLATSAVAENEQVASSLGLSPDLIATANWAIGSALAGAAAILISPIVQLQSVTMTNLVIAALAPALIAGFRSFPGVLFAAAGVGIVQSLVTRFTDIPGLGPSVPFLIIIIVLVIRGQSLPARDFFLQRLPMLGTGRIRHDRRRGDGPPRRHGDHVHVGRVAGHVRDLLRHRNGAALHRAADGYTGQISLAQYTIAGLGAWDHRAPGHRLALAVPARARGRHRHHGADRLALLSAGRENPRPEPRDRHDGNRRRTRAARLQRPRP